MEPFDWQRVLLNDLPVAYLGEVLLRVLFAYLLVYGFLKLSGRRGIRQLSLFELIIILTLGSAAGDVTFYEDVPVLPIAVVFGGLLLLYRGTTVLLERVPRLGDVIEGKPITLIRDGEFELGAGARVNLTSDEILMELRQRGVEHLGQVRLGILEADGDVSLYFYEGADVRPGLSVLPAEHRPVLKVTPEPGTFACIVCGATKRLPPGITFRCWRCGDTTCTAALTTRRL